MLCTHKTAFSASLVLEICHQFNNSFLHQFSSIFWWELYHLLHDLITGRSVTALLHFFNLTPSDWYCKRQTTVENATYGSEFVAAKTATEQIIDIKQTLRYVGVPIKSKAYMFGDNKSVVTSPSVPDRIPSTTPGAEPPRDAKDSGSARPHSTHPETSSTNRP